MAYLNCPACRLSIRAARARHEDCPRCLRRDGERVPLFSSPLPYRLLAADASGLDRGEPREQRQPAKF